MIEYSAVINQNNNRYSDFETQYRKGTLVATSIVEGQKVSYRYSDGLVCVNDKQVRGPDRLIALGRLFGTTNRVETSIFVGKTEHKVGRQPHFPDNEPGVLFKLKNNWYEIGGAVYAILSTRESIGGSTQKFNNPNVVPLITARLKLRFPTGGSVIPGRSFWRSSGIGQAHDASGSWISTNQYRINRYQFDEAGYMLVGVDPHTFALYGYAVRPNRQQRKRRLAKLGWDTYTIRLRGITEPAAAFVVSQLPYVI